MDLALARRLEATEGSVASSFVEARHRLSPQLGAMWRDDAGLFALFDGADSPITQTFGLGTLAPATPERLAELETFFTERGAATMHEVSPLAGVETTALLVERGYRPIEHSTVLVHALGEITLPASPLRVRSIDTRSPASDRETWIETSITGWSEDPAIATFMRPLSEVQSRNAAMVHFLVERADAPIATGSLGIYQDIALLAGASTIPSARGQGAQSLLLEARFAEAQRRGCRLAMMVTAPGSTSQRNAERSGFRVAYTRTKWQRDAVSPTRSS